MATTTTTNAAADAAPSTTRPAYTVGTALTTGAVAGVAAVVLNLVVSAVARGALGASDGFAPLTPAPIVLWTILGAVIGAAGWRAIVNKKADSAALLSKLVPTVLVLSLVPDVALLASGDAVPGQSTGAVVALMVMHVLTAAVVVTGYRRTMPAA